MAVIQAYRRTIPCTHEFPDVTLEFVLNANGDVVCDVQDQSIVDRLLLTPTGFRLYEPPESEPLAELLTAPLADGQDSPYILKSDEQTLDLRALGDPDLHALAKANGVAVHPNAKGDTIRNKIVEFFKSAE